ncbi:MAG TPA: J domain-containing protein [Terracidiphilus sp.]|nr:J domain-containing protein [Terracidiphilus sp.]
MRYCTCGNVAVEKGAECTRCRALRTLGLQAGATDREIRSAYHVLVKVWHPDRHQHDPALKAQAEEKLKAINSAYRYLTSNPASEEQRQAPPRTGNSSADEPSSAGQPPRRHSGAKRPSWISLFASISIPPVVITSVWLAGLVVIGWILFIPIDKLLASEPLTAAPYAQFKSEMRSSFRGAGASISDGVGEIWHNFVPRKSLPLAPAAPREQPVEPVAQRTINRQPYPVQIEPARIFPYVTAGLSRQEVIAVQGPPTSASENQLTYAHSELYFSSDKLVGWKIDPASPIRAKLWPDSPVDPDLDTFWLGSSKDQVIVAQGTPAMWSENTFGYGGSEVYFKDGRVVGWKNDPTTVPLRAAKR